MKLEELPLIIVSIDQGVPLLSSEWSILIHENLLDYESTRKIKEGSHFYVCFSTNENSALDLTNFEKAIGYTGPIGLKCTLKSTTTIEELKEMTCVPIEEVYLKKVTATKDSLSASAFPVEFDKDISDDTLSIELMSFIIFICSKIGSFPKTEISELKKSTDLLSLSNRVASAFFKENFDKYIYLQTTEESERVKMVITNLLEANDSLIDLSIKDFILLNQVKNDQMSTPRFFSSKNKKSTKQTKSKTKRSYPDHVRKVLEKESKRLSRTPGSSLESQAIQNYIETIQEVPWLKYSEEKPDLDSMVESITETHYGLKEVKTHILQHLVLESHLDEQIGTVLCFVGPPGTGKTSIAKSIAKATGREIIRIALGGVSDESEIRGHRRTYVAAKPGRLIDGLIKVKQMNPVIILDEVDKLDKGTRGDPTSALLELLDPEQNNEFIDRFVEIPIDLSKALFICTANYEEQIPQALRDRLELIYFKEYEKEERLEILKTYIYPNLIQKYQMDSFDIQISDCFFEEFAKEKSLRNLEKNISKILKSILVEFKIKKIQQIELNSESKKYLNTTKPQTSKIGFNNDQTTTT